MNAEGLMYGELAVIPIIVGVVAAVKRLSNSQWSGNVYFALSLGLGVVASFAVFLSMHGEGIAGWSFSTWLLAVLAGLSDGLSAGKGWDEFVKPTIQAMTGRGQ